MVLPYILNTVNIYLTFHMPLFVSGSIRDEDHFSKPNKQSWSLTPGRVKLV